MIKATISHESGEGDPHDLRSGRTKVDRRGCEEGRRSSHRPQEKPPEPLQCNTVWGIIRIKASKIRHDTY